MRMVARGLGRTLRSWLRTNDRIAEALGFEHTIWTRKVADESVRALIRPLEPTTLDVLEVSGHVWTDAGFRTHTATDYPAFDITRDVLPRQFDLVIMEHILEHLRHPARAVQNALAMLRNGGHLLVVTPFMYRVHADPLDCHRWTEMGLRNFLVDQGIAENDVTTGSWGNRACIRATMKREFIRYNRYVHSLRNEPDHPVVVWALAKKS